MTERDLITGAVIIRFLLRAGLSITGILFLLIPCYSAEAVMIDFDSLPGMTNEVAALVPEESRLTDAFLSSHGVSFTSAAGYVAVVNHGDPTPSPPNIIGGVRENGQLSHGTYIDFAFFYPSNSAIAGVTDFVSIRGELRPYPGATATMTAYSISGEVLGSVTADDCEVGLTLSLSLPGIHCVRLTQDSAIPGWSDGSIGFDNLMFNTVIPVFEMIPGDLNADGAVNSADLDIVRSNWNTTVLSGDLLGGDPSGDGYVGSADLDIVRANWLAGTSAAVPEPGVPGLLALGLSCVILRRRDGRPQCGTPINGRRI